MPSGFCLVDPSLGFLQAYLVQNCGILDILDPFQNRRKVKYKDLSICVDYKYMIMTKGSSIKLQIQGKQRGDGRKNNEGEQ